MIVRLWRARVAPGRAEDLETFARARSLSMLERQTGFEGVMFLREGDDWVTVTLWRDADAVEALATSPSYEEVVREITASGLLVGEQSVASFTLVDGRLPLLGGAVSREG